MFIQIVRIPSFTWVVELALRCYVKNFSSESKYKDCISFKAKDKNKVIIPRET